jgi:hypothetical protein
MNEGLARAFLAFIDARIKAGRPIKKGEIGLTNAQYSNFQNLRHFGLIHQPAVLSGAWETTMIGWAWYRGDYRIPSPVAHMGGNTLPQNHEAWKSHAGERTAVSIQDVLPEEWKQRAEFAAEKSGC